MSETQQKLRRKELGILIFRTFTKELIINSGPVSIAKLQTIVEKDKDSYKEKINEKPKSPVNVKKIQEQRNKKIQEQIQEQKLRQQILQREQSRKLIEQRRNQNFERLKLNVPETRLPERFGYLKPIPIDEKDEFGNKIDILLQDPNVDAIECPGENEEILVRGIMGEQRTEMRLTKKEIDDLINKFSELTKIPVSEGIYKVVYGKLILLAVVSEIVGSKFLIKKMKKPTQPPMISSPNAPLYSNNPPQAPQISTKAPEPISYKK